MTRSIFCALLAVTALNGFCANSVPAPPSELKVTTVPDELRAKLNLSPFYKKYVDCKGFPVLGSEKAQDAAMLEAARIVCKMLDGRDDIREAIIKNKIRLAVMAVTEQTTDIPEHSDLTPKDYWNKRARGLGATRQRPAVSCDEANLLHQPGDRYTNENILVHEFGHVIHEIGLNSIDPSFDKELRSLFEADKKRGLWLRTYAMENHKEFWAEGVQSYFDTNDNNNYQHNDVDTRAKLEKYDPEFFALLDKVFKQNAWHYERPGKAHPARKEHPPCVLAVSNETGAEVALYRVDGEKETAHATVEPGRKYETTTFQTQKFRAKIKGRDEAVDCVASEATQEWVIK
jgi:hypothetical protein